MPSNEQDLFDVSYILSSIDAFTEGIEQHFESVSRSLKDTFRDSTWLPDSIKPLPPPPLERRLPNVPVGYLETTRIVVSEHRAITAAVIAFLGTGAFVIWRHRRYDRAKRRAKKARNGAKTEVVVLAGSPHSPLTRSISQELERRGFIVYIPVSTISEEQLIQAEKQSDIRPLNLDITSPESTAKTIQKFALYISTPQTPSTKSPAHTLTFTALIQLPGSTTPSNFVTSISPSAWSDALNTRLLAPFTTLHAFLPLIISHHSNLLFLSPSIVPALTPPSQAVENVVSGGLQQYISTLRKEVQVQDVNVVQLKLGHLDYGLWSEDQQQQMVLSQHAPRAEATKQRLEMKGLVPKTAAKGTSLRELHNNIFDAIVRGKGKNGTIFVGSGARTYDLVGKWVPTGVVGWMLRDMGQNQRLPVPVEADRKESTDRSSEWDQVGERESDEEAYVYPKD